jgi:hypothetical protein
MFTSLNRLFQTTIAITGSMVSFAALSPVSAFDPATDHKCVAYCGGGSSSGGGGGGGYATPAYRGPSAAELARRRRVKAGNAANDRGIAALNAYNPAVAVGYFEEAMRLRPDDRTVKGNYWYAKGMAAYYKHDYAEAVANYKKSLTYNRSASQRRTLLAAIKDAEDLITEWPKIENQLAALKAGEDAQRAKNWEAAERNFRKAFEICNARNRIDCVEFEPSIYDAAGRAALERNDWDTAIREFAHQQKSYKDHPVWCRTQCAENILAAQQRIDAAKDAKQREQASNPNYPNPPPVYRDANTPRSYPDFTSFTQAQHQAHADNDSGNLWAQNGNWVQALLSYQKALTEEPSGPFAEVLKENLAIAMKHLEPQKTNAAPPNTAATTSPAPVASKEEKPKEIVQANCTLWSTANGTSSRVCADDRGHPYCEQAAQAGGKGAISRVSCQ